MKAPGRATLLLLLLAMALALRPGAAAPPAPPPDLESAPTRIAGNFERPADDPRARHAWLLAAPQGPFEVRVGDIALVLEGPLAQRIDGVAAESLDAEQLADALLVEELGSLRGVRLLRVVVDGSVPIRHDGADARLLAAGVEVLFPEGRRTTTRDSAWLDPDGSFPRLLRLVAANGAFGLEVVDESPAASTEFMQGLPDWRPGPGEWRRVAIEDEGVHAIDGRWMAEAGFDPAAVDPDAVRLVADGREIPMLRTGPARAGFATGARLLFHARPSDAVEERARIYWLGVGTEGPAPRRMAEAARHDRAPLRERWTRAWRVEEDDSLRTRVGSFLSIREMRWVWKELPPNEAVDLPFALPGFVEDEAAARIRVRLDFGGRRLPGRAMLEARLGGEAIGSAEVLAGEADFAFEAPARLLRTGRNTLELSLSVPEHLAPRFPASFVDELEVAASSRFAAESGKLLARFDAEEGGGPARLRAIGFRAPRTIALDLTDPDAPIRLPVEADGQSAIVHAGIVAGRAIKLLEDDAAARAPNGVAPSALDLRRTDLSADYLVVAHERFLDEAALLVEALEAEGREVLLVDAQAVYDSWSAGGKRAEAIRRFAQHAVREWEGRRPAHLLLVGDCSSDGRGIARNDVENLLPTWNPPAEIVRLGDQYACDAYFSWLVGDGQVADILVGRISVESTVDAAEAIGRQIDHRGREDEPWAHRLLAIADPGEFADEAAAAFRRALDPSWRLDFIQSGRELWEDNIFLPRERLSGDEVKVAPGITRRIVDAMGEGVGVVAFFGHGSPNIWSNQRIWFAGGTPNSDNLRLSNRGRLPFAVSFTCNNAAIDYPARNWNICFAEDMMRVPNGGAVGAFMPSGPGYTTRHAVLAEGFLSALTIAGEREAGVLAEASRLAYQAAQGSDDHSRMFILLGDPSLRLPGGARTADLELSPRVLGGGVAQGLRVSLGAVGEPIESARVVVRDAQGRVAGEGDLRPGEDGAAEGHFVVRPAPDAREFAVHAEGATVSGRPIQAGARLHRLPAEVVVAAFEPSADGRRAIATVVNAAPHDAVAVLQIAAPRPGGAPLVLANERLPLAPGESRVVEAPLDALSGPTILEALVSPRDPLFQLAELPSAIARRAFVPPAGTEQPEPAAQGPDAPILRIAQGGIALLPALARNATPRIEAHLANTGTEAVADAGVAWRVKGLRGFAAEGVHDAGSLLPGEVRRVVIPVELPSMEAASLAIQLEPTLGGDPVEGASESMRLDASSLPDLEIDPRSLATTPPRPTEGVTILVEGIVRNRGRARSHAARAALYHADDEALARPLRSFGGFGFADIPPLEPGQSWPILLRWDPTDNLGVEAIRVVVDSQEVLVEPSKSNNSALVPISVRSKWALGAGGMEVGASIPPSPEHPAGAMTLVARIVNDGETDARRVVVFFHRDEDQTPETLIGEVLVDRVPAGGTVFVEFQWDLRGVDLQAAIRPSFAFGIKGSLMRQSSVLDD